MLSHTQLVELFVVLCIIAQHRFGFLKARSTFIHAHAQSSPIRPDAMAATLLAGAPFFTLQAIATNLIPTIYIHGIVGAGLQQPSWANAFALPEVILSLRLEGIPKNALRVLVCGLGLIAMRSMTNRVFRHLGDQYHPIGRRQKPRVVRTGPYALVRHPIYALALLQAVFQSLAFWSYAPLFALVATAIVFAVKIPVEEEIIQQDDGIREDYRAYMRKVPARLIPYVW